MTNGNRRFLIAIATLFFLWGGVSAQWTQWGGPHRDFSVEGGPLTDEWPAQGPREIWRRTFGDGFSSILVEGDRLYAMRRDGDNDVAVCLDAADGGIVWESSYPSPTVKGMVLDFGPGPITTPLLVGDRLFTVSSTVKFSSFDKNSGKTIWRRDLMKEMGASHLGRGYGPSPVAYRDTVILGVGGPDHAVVAFDQKTGEMVWKSQNFGPSYSSPILVKFGGRDMLIVGMGVHRAGLDPSNGELLWSFETPKVVGSMMSTLNFGADGIIIGSMAYGGGSRALQLRQADDGSFSAEELWYTRKMKVMYGSFVRIGDEVYGSSGGFGPSFIQAVDVKTGKILWRERGFSRANLLHADGKVIVLDEDGDLAIATVDAEGMTIHSRAHVMTRTSWTPPTLAGRRLYVRDRKTLAAFDLGPQ